MPSRPTWLSGRRVAYVPYSADHSAPGDRRRFAYWARERGVRLEVPRPGERYDLVVLSTRADITTWARLPRNGMPIVYELIDSYLDLRPGRQDFGRGTGKWLFRQHAHLVPSYLKAVETMCRRADIVVCSTPEQEEVLRAHADDVRPILDVHEEVPVRTPRPAPVPGLLRLFWEGLPENLRGFHAVFNSALRELSAGIQVQLHLVTDPVTYRWFGRVGRFPTTRLIDGLPGTSAIYRWSVSSLSEVAGRCDVGVIPLDLRDPLAAGKPENKLALMWRLGLPVVATATPAYRRVMKASGLNLTCSTSEEWVELLLALAQDRSLREEAADRGDEYVRTHHSREALLGKWDKVVQDAVGISDAASSADGCT